MQSVAKDTCLNIVFVIKENNFSEFYVNLIVTLCAGNMTHLSCELSFPESSQMVPIRFIFL